MSKISVTTIAGLTSGGDANTVKIESGDTLAVQSNATVGGTASITGNTTVGGTLGVTGVSTLTGNTTVGGTLGVTGVSTLTGNVGIGITPDTISNGKSIQINRSVINDDDSGDNGFVHITQNGYYNSAWKYVENGTAEKISFSQGTIRFDNASSNSSGADASLSWSERMRMNSSGHLLIGTTSTTPNPGISLQSNGNIGIGNSNGNSGSSFLEFRRNATQIGGVIQSGTTGVSYGTSSDYRLKENVKTDWDATTRLEQLKPSRFNFIADADKTVDGFLAHEVSSIVPEAITGEKDATETYIDDDGKEQTRPVYQIIDQSKLVPLLVKALQEALARIKALESK